MSIEKCREKFIEFLSAKDLRVTQQRLAIFEACHTLGGHFTAEELLVEARGIDPSVSRATIYRTLPILIESALLREIDVGKDFKFYSIAPENANEQAQVFCIDCEKIYEVDAPFLGWYGSTVSAKFNLRPISQRLQIRAKCQQLELSGTCPNKSA
ncbi:MAG: transcriptional repressor [Opitutales bacterium]|nr:transcriptional repressor [Opitutales bacterium]